MKIRTDYVTNSSSSSFILVFENNKEYERFLSQCDFLDYEKLAILVKRNKKNVPQDEQVKNAKELLHRYFEMKYRRQILEEKFFDENDDEIPFDIIIKRNSDYEKTDEYKTKLKNLLDADNEYQDKLKQINDAEIVIQTMIWDTNGGILELAIRNGFLESEFGWNTILRWNIG